MFNDGSNAEHDHVNQIVNYLYHKHNIDEETVTRIEMDDDSEKDAYTELQKLGLSGAETNVLLGYGDAREYGFKHLGWIRVSGNHFQLEHLTPETLHRLVTGVEGFFDSNLNEELVHIEAESTGAYYESIPFPELVEADQTGNFSGLIRYRKRESRNE